MDLRFLLIYILLLYSALSQTLDDTWDIPNNYARAVAFDNTYTYIAGQFSGVGRNVSNATVLTKTDVSANLNFPQFNSSVRDVVDDGNGGWYFCGDFTKVDDLDIQYLVHINADYTVDETFDLNVNYFCRALERVGTDLYVGGDFGQVSGLTRSRIVKINLSSKTVDNAWDADADGRVYDIRYDGNDLIIGGDFNTVGGQARPKLAKINTSNGSVDLSFDADCDDLVERIDVDGSDLFVAGSFRNVGGLARDYCAKLNLSNGNADVNWDATPNSVVKCIKKIGSYVYLGGLFTNLNGGSITRLARVSETNGVVDLTWNPQANLAYEIQSDGNHIYASGNFGTVQGVLADRLARLSISDGTIDATWTPILNNPAYAIRFNGDEVVIGGDFKIANMTYKSRVARINSRSGRLDETWIVSADNTVKDIEVSGDYLYLGGEFNRINNTIVGKLARVNISNGALDATWAPSANGVVNDIEIQRGYCYVGGEFTNIGGRARNYISKINLTNGNADATWNPNADNFVLCVEAQNSNIYIGGNFNTVNGSTRNNIARIDYSSGIPDSWNPNSNGEVRDIIIDNDDVFVGGDFGTIGGQSKNRVAKLDATTGLADVGWARPNNSWVNDLEIIEDTLYIAGNFSEKIKKVNKNDASLFSDFAPGTGGEYLEVKIYNRFLFILGTFSFIDDRALLSFAKFNIGSAKPSFSSEPYTSNIKANKVTINAELNDNGEETNVKYFIGKSANLYFLESNFIDSPISANSGNTLLSEVVSNLEPNTNYILKVQATNSIGVTEKIISFQTIEAVDTDQDGIFDYIEEEAPFGGDGNGDGILDKTQLNVCSFINQVSFTYITLETTDCPEINSVKVVNNLDADKVLPFGAFEFKLPCSSAKVNIYLHDTELNQLMTYRKLSPEDIWFDFTNYSLNNKVLYGNIIPTITLSLTDGGVGDYDGEINGVIYDPGGPAIPISQNIPIWDWWWVLIFIFISIYVYSNTTRYQQ